MLRDIVYIRYPVLGEDLGHENKYEIKTLITNIFGKAITKSEHWNFAKNKAVGFSFFSCALNPCTCD